MLNEDYRDMLHALSEEKVKFLLVGAFALAAHGYPRSTMHIDIWVMPSPENAEAVLLALRRYGAALGDLTKEDLEKDFKSALHLGDRPPIELGIPGLPPGRCRGN